MAIINDQIKEVEDQLPTLAELPPLNAYSIVLNLNIIMTKVDLIFKEIASQKRPLSSLLAPSIQQTLIDEASRKD
jgi:hypothetical protein